MFTKKQECEKNAPAISENIFTSKHKNKTKKKHHFVEGYLIPKSGVCRLVLVAPYHFNFC